MQVGVQQAREGAPDRLAVVSTAATEVGAQLSDLQTRLAALKADLANIQAKALALKEALPEVIRCSLQLCLRPTTKVLRRLAI
jgi:hypothetical protein